MKKGQSGSQIQEKAKKDEKDPKPKSMSSSSNKKERFDEKELNRVAVLNKMFRNKCSNSIENISCSSSEFQFNPYNLAKYSGVTPKVNEKKAEICQNIPDFEGRLKQAVILSIGTPQQKYSHPQTESQRYGWFPKNFWNKYAEDYTNDERFNHTRKTSRFIKDKLEMMARDKALSQQIKKESETSAKSVKSKA